MMCGNFLINLIFIILPLVYGSILDVDVTLNRNVKLDNVVAPYQVVIRWAYLSPNASITNLCNGVIVSKDYVLTTASCLHMPAPWAPSEMIAISASQMYIVAGNFSLLSNENGVRRNVISVILHNQFMFQSGWDNKNDIALLKLDRSLPLDGTVNWIELQQVPTYGNCYLVPQVFMNSNIYPYYKQPNTSVSESWICTQPLPDNSTTSDKLCLQYYDHMTVQYTTQNRFLCKDNNTLLQHSIERGTGLICDERIAGLLSQIHPPVNPAYCEATGRTFATYTNISEFSDWIRTEAALYFYNSSSAGNSTSSPSWTWNQSKPPKQNNAAISQVSVLTICVGLLTVQARLVYQFLLIN